MKLLKPYFLLFLFGCLAISCSDDDDGSGGPSDPFVVAFEELSQNLINIDGQATVNLTYSEETTTAGSITINFNGTNAEYGTDFTTTPAATNGVLVLDISQNENSNSFIFNKVNPAIDEEAVIVFEIVEIMYDNASIQGNTNFTFSNSASLGGSIQPEVGGPNEDNQVFVDLSNNNFTTAKRDSWDLGFASGNDFRVVINSSIYMFAAALPSTDIDAVNSSTPEVQNLQPLMNIGEVGAQAFADNPNGDLNETAIAEIDENDSNNPVYLINMGFEVPNTDVNVGSVDVDGDPRGWVKIRILRNNNGYTLQYADLDDTSHTEVSISKNNNFNFSFFSIENESVVSVQPEKNKWDLCFTVFTNVISFGGPLGAYGFSDFVIHNRLGNARAYALDDTSSISYQDFDTADIDDSLFSEDQNVIGSSWRNVFAGTVTDNIFYIVQDPNNNVYKIRFTALTDPSGVRGYPEFEFKLLD